MVDNLEEELLRYLLLPKNFLGSMTHGFSIINLVEDMLHAIISGELLLDKVSRAEIRNIKIIVNPGSIFFLFHLCVLSFVY